MSSRTATERLNDLLEPLADAHGFELVATEVCGPKGHPVVRVYLDREGGIDLEAITEANGWISEAFDADPPVSGPYVLEVSSPGIERPLRRPEDFERFAGSEAVVKTVRPLEGRRNFTGTLDGIEGEAVLMTCGGVECRLPLEAIAKASLKAEVDFGDE